MDSTVWTIACTILVTGATLLIYFISFNQVPTDKKELDVKVSRNDRIDDRSSSSSSYDRIDDRSSSSSSSSLGMEVTKAVATTDETSTLSDDDDDMPQLQFIPEATIELRTDALVATFAIEDKDENRTIEKYGGMFEEAKKILERSVPNPQNVPLK